MAFLRSVISRLKRGLEKTQESLVGGLRSLLLGKRLDADLIRQIELRLIQADVGLRTTRRLIDGIRADFESGKLARGDDALEYIKRELAAIWPEQDRELHFARPDAQGAGGAPITVFLVVGVNGAGKTTSIAKLARLLRDQGKTVLLAACDTYRAGAVRQLEIWAERLGVGIVKGAQGGDPAAVAFDACDAAIARGVDVLIVDTAGRIHTQESLMRQLAKIRDIVARKIPGAPHEVLLVLDATTGQNALRQAEEFSRTINVTGIILAKLDGTARGGVVIAIHEATRIPVKFVGVGEHAEDLERFEPAAFVEALFAEDPVAAREV